MTSPAFRLGLFPEDVRPAPPPPVPLGTGWAFPVALTPPLSQGARGLQTASEVDHLIQSVRLILMTARGERVRRPWFGSTLWQWLDAPITAKTLAGMRAAIAEALREEPRATVRQIRIENPTPAHLLMTIDLETAEAVTIAVTLQYDRDRRRWVERSW